MNLPLLKQSIKANLFLWGGVTAIMNIILAQLLMMDMAEMIPTMYYGMLCLTLVSLYIVITANNLLAGQVDRGSMAYILSTPIRRSTVAITQMAYMIGSLAVTFATTTITFLIANNLSDAGMDTNTIIYLNIGAFVAALALSGICFLSSGVFNLSKYSIGTGGMIVVAFLLLALIGSFSNYGVSADLDIFNNLTIISLYDIQEILQGSNDWIPKLAVLGLIAAGTYGIGSVAFVRKDLPL